MDAAYYESLIPRCVQVTATDSAALSGLQLTTWQKMVRGAVSSVVPNDKYDDGEPVVNDYISHYNCRPPPLFMIGISLTEVGALTWI